MKILYLTTEFPWPADSGGRVHSLAQLRLLSSLGEVTGLTLLSLVEGAVREADRDGLSRELPGVRVLPPLRHPIHLLQQPHRLVPVAWLRLTRGVPYLAGKWDAGAIRDEIRRQLAHQAFDLVYIDHLGMARYLPEVRAAQLQRQRLRIVLEEHNVESDLFRQFYLRRGPGPLRWLAFAEWQRARRFEAETLRVVDAVVAISADDAASLRQLAGIAAVVVPQVVIPSPPGAPGELRQIAAVVVPQVVTPSSGGPSGAPGSGAPALCYVGNLTWHPNVQGLDWFLSEVWPVVRRHLPLARLTIAGSGLAAERDGGPRVPPRWRVAGVEVVGFLPDLQPLYDRSLAMIVPILGGSGIRIKLLEALRAGMPVVTTPQGAAGLSLAHEREVLIAADADRFAAALVRLCGDGALRQRLREAGARYLLAHHSLSAAQKAMRQALGLL